MEAEGPGPGAEREALVLMDHQGFQYGRTSYLLDAMRHTAGVSPFVCSMREMVSAAQTLPYFSFLPSCVNLCLVSLFLSCGSVSLRSPLRSGLWMVCVWVRKNESEGIFNYKNNNGGGTRPKTKEFHSSGAWVWRGRVQVSFRTGGNWRLVPWGTHWKGKKTNQKNKNVVFTLKPGEIREPYIAHFPSTRNHVARFISSAKLSPYIEHLVCLYLTEHRADRFTQ